jgi:hypothetical protein
MARAIFGLLPLVLVGCFLESDPDAPVTLLSNVAMLPKVSFSASGSRVRAAIEVDPWAIGACVTLDDDFQSTLNGVPMAIRSRGGSGGSIGSSVPCYPPVIELIGPPTTDSAVIAISYPRHTISIDLGDLLVARSAQPVPDGPFVFEPGKPITLRWSPASDLQLYEPSVEFALAGTRTRDVAPVTVADDVLSFALAVTSRPDELRITQLRDLRTEVEWSGCTGARCVLIQTPAFTHGLAWR